MHAFLCCCQLCGENYHATVGKIFCFCCHTTTIVIYFANLIFFNIFEQLTAQQRYSDFMRYIFEQTKTIDQSSIYDEKLYRQLKLLSSAGPAALPADQLDRVGALIAFNDDWMID